MTLLVDTYNVLHVVGVLPESLAGVNVEGLAKLIAVSRYRKKKPVLICDGVGQVSERLPGEIQVIFSGPKLSADEVIVGKICAASHPRQMTVVTSDRAVQRAVRRRRAKVIGSPDFLEHLVTDSGKSRHRKGHSTPAPPSGKLSDSAVEAWAQYLDIDLEQFDVSELTPSAQTYSLPPPPKPQPEAQAPPNKNKAPRQRDASPHPDFSAEILEQAKRLLDEEGQG